ncbi:MAG: hypothetical protein PHT40_02605 [Patescibacteria group bacterium]|nr:hypothetical protein [Patescibacteria group bacterium]
MQKGCQQCLEIVNFEEWLDIQAAALVNKQIIHSRPIQEYNNEKWRIFASQCNLPVIGSLIFKTFKAPSGLKTYPDLDYKKKPWYIKEGQRIGAEAKKLEQLKANHLEHWGDETVSTNDWTDPSGYYTPSYAPRSECYKRGISPFVPSKYDFHSGAGCAKFNIGIKVMCALTKQLVPVNDCDMMIGNDTDWKPIYWQSKFTPPNPSVPGFNEWRDDEYYRTHQVDDKMRVPFKI